VAVLVGAALVVVKLWAAIWVPAVASRSDKLSETRILIVMLVDEL
jgi:Na+/melibiose symporter-like transporter